MVDVPAIAGTVSALKGAMDIAKTMVGLANSQAARAKVIELQAAILDAQQSAFAANEERATLIKRVSALEEKLRGVEKWDAEKQRYELVDIGDGNVAYQLKPPMRGGEPPHYVCANCYQKGKISILAHMDTRSMGDLLTCAGCQTKNLISRNYKPAA